ncbi:phosphoglycerate mutase family protein-like protein [Calycina marina]|uniref:Phosphoglycerate mutase family protein-like protein n=1 Tax=Calycina marina TaxID=1763456 RepID=A0A9P8CHE3_9HELO|nr:phosphoglycerate mutase family protein-like protein [Calycina marina]
MGKATLYLVRHAQGFHNLNAANHQIPDPSLTPLGEEQCHTLAKAFPATFPKAPKITHLVSSPLRRTIYTTLLSFPKEVKSGLVITALPQIQETSQLPCDTGSDSSKLVSEFGSKIDLHLVKEGWNNKQGKWSPAASAITARARDARVWLRDLATSALAESDEDVNIVMTTHGGFLHFFTNDWLGYTTVAGTGWANTEFRAYEFGSTNDTDASIYETEESRQRRKGHELPLTKDEQRELANAAHMEAVQQGYLNAELTNTKLDE